MKFTPIAPNMPVYNGQQNGQTTLGNKASNMTGIAVIFKLDPEI